MRYHICCTQWVMVLILNRVGTGDVSLLFRHMNCFLSLEVVSYGFSIFQIDEHLEKECPNTEIKCPFHVVGCTYEV